MARKKLNPNSLFNTSAKLIEGYSLTASYGKEQAKGNGGTGRKVYLVGRPLASGNVSLVRYACTGGTRQREATGKVLRIELDATIKQCNKDIVREERAMCDYIESELIMNNSSFVASTRGNVMLSDFLFGDRLKKSSELDSVGQNMRALSNHVIKYRDVRVCDVTEEWVRGFVQYLKNDAVRMSVKNQEPAKLQQNTQNKHLVVLSVALNRAVEKKMLMRNPVTALTKKERIKQRQNTRTFLEASEIKRLAETTCEGDVKHGYDIKRAFLFSVMTGIRWSDVRQLSGNDLREDENGTFINKRMQKTDELLHIYVGAKALSLVPTHTDKAQLLFRLPSNKTANDILKKWVEAAGIDKKVTFHCSRHSCATLLLSNGVALQNVSAQLGHVRMATTEIYAKLVNESRKHTADKMDEIAEGIL